MTRVNKYSNIRVKADGYSFDSKMEYRRYRELLLLQQAGLIFGLEVHPSFTIMVNQVKVCRVVADFSYFVSLGLGAKIVEDVKGKDNPLSKLKRQLLFAAHGITTTLICK